MTTTRVEATATCLSASRCVSRQLSHKDQRVDVYVSHLPWQRGFAVVNLKAPNRPFSLCMRVGGPCSALRRQQKQRAPRLVCQRRSLSLSLFLPLALSIHSPPSLSLSLSFSHSLSLALSFSLPHLLSFSFSLTLYRSFGLSLSRSLPPPPQRSRL